MPTPYAERDEGSVESVAEQMADLPMEALTGVPEEEGAIEASEEQSGSTQDAPEKEAEDDQPAEAAEQKPADGEQEQEPAADMVQVGDREIPLTELVSAYEKSQSDSAEVSAHIEQLTQQAQATVQQQLAPLVQTRQQLVQALQQVQAFNPLPPEPDRRMLDPNSEVFNPDAYHQQKADHDHRAREYQQFQAQVQQQQQLAQQEQARIEQQNLQREQQALLKAWPELSGEQGQDIYRKSMADLSKHYGFDDDTINSVVDHRFYLLARDALAYRNMQGKAPETRRKIQEAPKVVKSGGRVAAPKPADKAGAEARKRLAKTGSLDDAADALASHLFD